MLVRELKRLLIFVGPAIFLILLVAKLCGKTLISLPSIASPSSKGFSSEFQESGTPSNHVGHPFAGYTEGAYREIFSLSTSDKKYFKVKFHPHRGINPNAIPHPTLESTWIIVSQRHDHSVKDSVWFAELFCNAVFTGEALSCIEPPFILPIGRTRVRAHHQYENSETDVLQGRDKCIGDLGYFGFNVGPHDARVFYGPSAPYTIYGSNSQYTCFGQWIQDLRLLTDWPFEFFNDAQFSMPTELQRPEPYGMVEKNYFIFWDRDENVYAHYDVFPKRVFARLSDDGSTGPDLAPKVATGDDKCINKYMQKLALENESIHQATSSISITLCKRSDPGCQPDDSNTFILTVFQHKKFYSGHAVYDPYVMLFEQKAPFALYGISTKPFWISGRGMPGEWKDLNGNPSDQTQMIYVTSLSWKKAGQKYHGYIDDVLFVLFGIEDSDTGGIDIVAGDLLADLGLCALL